MCKLHEVNNIGAARILMNGAAVVRHYIWGIPAVSNSHLTLTIGHITAFLAAFWA